MSYCHLSSPGYREETLRRGEQEALGALGTKVQEFNISSFQKTFSRRETWTLVNSMDISPSSTHSFDALGGATPFRMTARKSGLFIVSPSCCFRIYHNGNNMSQENYRAPVLLQMKKGDELMFKTNTGSQNVNLTITEI